MNKISIIICTYNRATILKEAIYSIIEKCKGFRDCELIIIDNNSNDNTYKISLSLMEKYKNIKYYKEKKQGLSVARNTGIRISKNEIIVFIDDDVIIKDDYLENIKSFFEKNKEAICGGGRIDTIWSVEKPDWFNPGFFSIIGETRYGNLFRELKGQEYPYGGNMFFRKKIFNEIGNFDENLGLNGVELKMGEEVDLFSKIRNKGYEIYYDPNIVLGHRIHINKLEKSYVNKRWEEEGKATGIILSKGSKKDILKSKFKRKIILIMRDYPMWIISKVMFSKNEFYWRTKINKNKEMLKNMKYS